MRTNTTSQYIGKKIVAIDECRLSAIKTLTIEGGAEIDVCSGSTYDRVRDRAEGEGIGAELVKIERRFDSLGKSFWMFIFKA